MVVFLAAIAFLFVLICFLEQRRRNKEAWESFRQRFMEKRRDRPPARPIDPNFQFDQSSGDEGRDQ
jgi:hypothetical protein